jgi:hypothetical protein
MRRERREKPPIDTLLARRSRESGEERAAREQAEELFRRFHGEGVTWAACVQAVKTNWVASLLAKHEGRRRERGGTAPEEKTRPKS